MRFKRTSRVLTAFLFAAVIASFSAAAMEAPENEGEERLLRPEGGCVFITEDASLNLSLEYGELSALEREAVKGKVGMKELPEGLLYSFIGEVMYSVARASSGVAWDVPQKLFDANTDVKVFPAIAAGFKKGEECSKCEKLRFFIGKKSFITSGSVFLSKGALHLVINKIKGKPRLEEVEGKLTKKWKLIVGPPVKFQRGIGHSSEKGEILENWIYYPLRNMKKLPNDI